MTSQKDVNNFGARKRLTPASATRRQLHTAATVAVAPDNPRRARCSGMGVTLLALLAAAALIGFATLR